MVNEKLKSRVVYLEDGDQVKIHGPVENPNSAYSHFYQNKGTKALDTTFEMDGEPISNADPRLSILQRSVGSFSLGKDEVESTLRYFAFVASKMGNFVGLLEDELRNSNVDTSGIDISLRYKDDNQGPYLVRKEVDGKAVLFPQNLEKMLF